MKSSERNTEKIVFFGTPSFALPALKSLLEGPDPVIAVVTQPDRPKGRGRKVGPPPVKALALQAGVRVLQPERVKEAFFLETIRTLEPDLFVVVAYGQLLPKSLLIIPRHGAINVHASLLPKYRGAAPIPWAILRGEEVTGVTTMMMDEGLDTGDILLQAPISIGQTDTSETLHDRLAVLGAQLLRETVDGVKTGAILPKPQDHSQATYSPLIRKEEGWIDWKKGAIEIDRQVRAFSPWPGAYTRWQDKVLKIDKGSVRGNVSRGEPGGVLWVGSDFIEVATGKGCFLILDVQLEGGKRMGIRQFLSGHAIPVATTLG